MGGYSYADGYHNGPAQVNNVAGVNILENTGANNGISCDMYIGAEDLENGHPNDTAALYLLAGGQSFNSRVQFGDAATMTVGGLNNSGTVSFNDFFLTLPTDGNGVYNAAPAGVPFANAGKSIVIDYSAAAGGTVIQNFQLIRGGGSGFCGASVDKVGAGTWIVNAGGTSPTGEQAYQGTTTVRDGTLELAYDDTGTNYVTLPAAALADPGATYMASGTDGGSLGYNAPTNTNPALDTNAVNLGDSGTLPTDNIAFLTLQNTGAPGPRQILHNLIANNDNPSGTTTIGVADNGVGNYSGNILLKRNVILTGGTGGTANFTGNITGTGAVNVGGAGTVNLSGANTYSGGTSVGAGATLVVATVGSLPTSAITNNGTLTVNANATVDNISGSGTLNVGLSSAVALKIAANTHGSSEGAVNIGANSSLDIGNNHLFINYAAGHDPISSISALLKSGFNAGSWNGVGINSSNAQANSGSYGLGFADSADLGNPAGLASNQIEVAYTLLGDANLDGKVNGADFAILATNFNKAVTGTSGWDQGDFNYDGKINGADFAALAANFNKGASQADTTALDSFAAVNGLSAAVPEPASLGLMTIASAVAMRRRKRS
jgi:autotransporter-associated beta strand protein